MILLAAGSLALTITPTMIAQEPPPPSPPPSAGNVIFMQGPGGMGEGFHGEIGEGKVVTGIPLTAQITVTRENTLADGNHIYRTSQTTLYRDSQGRVRREMTVDIGTPATGGVKRTMIMIKDPVAGKRYMLDPRSKTARQLLAGPKEHGPHPGQPGGEPMKKVIAELSVQQQDLGTKTVEGVQADGIRVTRTIAAGEIGNEKPIEVVTERWFSNELQLPLLVTHSDPMMGTVTTKVTSMTRGEPDASLFQLPSDYKVVSGRPDEPFYLPLQP